ncbi:unnamed protein product [Microthlaspi erraticum]|uniref:F-box domain-containing protein n=1 Tax=Microthlaspi erraticum TaxID=1685480 RepID=A0A6D2J4S4_9BRAS|nr:unnamed protein product [Microthlaspi erraticum]
MEQSGGSLKKRGVDRISDLPEPLALKILSLLPTKLVISTSVLSKQWRSVWKKVPKLEFESYGNIQNVCNALLSHKAPVLESLHLKVRDRCEDVYIGIWAGIAMTRHVREFALSLGSGKPVRFPSCLFCLDTLETLKLKDYVLLDLPCPVPMKSLKTLHLDSVTYKDESSVGNLLSSCSNLEHLVVRRGYFKDDVKHFVIVAPSLKTLSLYDPMNGRGDKGYVINAPCLKYLDIEKLERYEFCLIENASDQLVEAKIRDVVSIANESIMASLTSAKRLCLDLSPLQITYPSGVSFYQLVSLEMYTHKVEWWNLLTIMLDSSPKLQVLKLIDASGRQHSLIEEKKYMKAGKWNEPKCVPECLLSSLETFVWTRHDWIRGEEKEVAFYILRNAICLKKATFTTFPIEAKMHFKLARRREMLSELNGVVMASHSCQLVFQSQ